MIFGKRIYSLALLTTFIVLFLSGCGPHEAIEKLEGNWVLMNINQQFSDENRGRVADLPTEIKLDKEFSAQLKFVGSVIIEGKWGYHPKKDLIVFHLKKDGEQLAPLIFRVDHLSNEKMELTYLLEEKGIFQLHFEKQ